MLSGFYVLSLFIYLYVIAYRKHIFTFIKSLSKEVLLLKEVPEGRRMNKNLAKGLEKPLIMG